MLPSGEYALSGVSIAEDDERSAAEFFACAQIVTIVIAAKAAIQCALALLVLVNSTL